MSKVDRNRIKNGWENSVQANRQTKRQTDTTKIMVTWPWTKNCQVRMQEAQKINDSDKFARTDTPYFCVIKKNNNWWRVGREKYFAYLLHFAVKKNCRWRKNVDDGEKLNEWRATMRWHCLPLTSDGSGACSLARIGKARSSMITTCTVVASTGCFQAKGQIGEKGKFRHLQVRL